jgi:hypothetical protein
MDVDPYKNDPLDRGAPVLKTGFREASVKEIRGWNIDARDLRRLFEAAKERDEKMLVVDDVFGGTAWKRNSEGHGALILRADVLEQALGPR